ncbi:acyltransferase [Fibrobacter sp.]|uniref:acyltransferase family protein n=1 Tax=Fibrobacter sp. TaxID=35828 RepID=UPI0038639462
MNSKGVIFSSDLELFSRVINRIRFPLIVLVVMIHSGGALAESPVLFALDRIMSELLPSCAVPTFFLISGYLYFIGVDALNREIYVKKMKRRVWSLLIPYLLWNSLALLPLLLKNSIALGDVKFSYLWEYRMIETVSPLGFVTLSCYPIDGPLWYVRDLIVYSFFSPVIYFFIKRAKFIFLLILAIVFFFKIWPPIFLHPNGFVFFSLGALFALCKITPLVESKYCGASLFCAFIICLFLQILCPNLYISTAYKLCSVFFAVNMFALVEKRIQKKPSKFLLSSVFFVFALHQIEIVDKIKFYLPRFFGDSLVSLITCYVLTPVLTIACCLIIFVVMQNVSPRVTKILNGR